MSTDPKPAALRDRVAQAIRDAACSGGCGLTKEECAKERIQPFVWHHGRLAVVEGSPEQIADVVLAVLPPVSSSGRAALLHETADRAAIKAEAYHDCADEIEAWQARMEHEERDEHGNLDHETELQGEAVRDMAKYLREQAAWLRRVAAEEQPAETRCGCGHAADEHSVYGCIDGCGCDRMFKRPSMDPVHVLGAAEIETRPELDVTPLDVDDTDLSEADVDRMMAEGVPVRIVTAPPATYGAQQRPVGVEQPDTKETRRG